MSLFQDIGLIRVEAEKLTYIYLCTYVLSKYPYVCMYYEATTEVWVRIPVYLPSTIGDNKARQADDMLARQLIILVVRAWRTWLGLTFPITTCHHPPWSDLPPLTTTKHHVV